METRFGFKDFIQVFASSIALYGFFIAFFSAIPGAAELLESMHPSVSFLIHYGVQFVILGFPLWFFVVRKYDATLLDFGFQRIPFRRLLWTVLFAYALYFFFSGLIAWALYATELTVPGYEAQDSYLPLFGTDFFGLSMAFLFIVIIAPFIEEFFFRGFIYRVFTKTWPVWLGSVFTAALFALIHFQFHSFIPLFILGLVLNISYQRTQSLWTPIAFHMMNNLVAFGVEIYLLYSPSAWEQLETIRVFVYNWVNILF